jgi:hypothetical protein
VFDSLKTNCYDLENFFALENGHHQELTTAEIVVAGE